MLTIKNLFRFLVAASKSGSLTLYQKRTCLAAIVVPRNIFHLALLEHKQFQDLAFDDIKPETLEFYNFVKLHWRRLDYQTPVHLTPTVRRLLLCDDSRTAAPELKFPPRLPHLNSNSLHAFPETSRAVTFKKVFPNYPYNERELEAALELWGSTPHTVQTVFKDAGHTDAGLWSDLVKDSQRRELAAAVQKRRSAVKSEIIVIDN
ncbi:hypothetical protein AURDEDRAFT_167767 [Auricularia subglabra TFB-10046 SS5]|nr:hypothetical protein AURDEDRAFT_167767 [Auricularia subglabra TFB-10046 SS5]